MTSPPEDQEKLLDEALSQIKSQTFQMKRCLDKSLLMDGLKHSTNMLGELRTTKLSPRHYYELYMTVSDELRHLELYLIDEHEKGQKLQDLYELVQYAGNILPRLYLLITVGVVYIKCSKLPSCEILHDLVEMCRGVQHPLRGLFLRNYLLQCMRGELLPDFPYHDKPELNNEKGTVKDSVNFILLNFCEMNKLWVRMQHQGHSRDKDRREQERRELRLLVGSNLDRLSKLESIDLAMYQNVILPQLLEQIIKCRDAIAHEYLMDVIVQVFPDEFHLATLDTLLRACSQLEPQVQINKIIISLIERLANYVARGTDSNILSDYALFEILSTEINRILESKKSMSGEDVISLQTALLNLALKIYPDREDYVNMVLQNASNHLEQLDIFEIRANSNISRELIRLLRAPIDVHRGDLQKILGLTSLPTLMQRLDDESCKQVCFHLISSCIESQSAVLPSCDSLERFFKLIAVLLKETISTDSDSEIESEDFLEEQHLISRCIHLISADTETHGIEEQFRMLVFARKQLSSSGVRKLRHILPSIVTKALIFAEEFNDKLELLKSNEEQVSLSLETVFKFIHQCCRALVHCHSAETAVKLYLESALIMDKVQIFPDREKMLYDMLSEVITLFEEEVRESRCQVIIISLIINTLERLTSFCEDNHNPLRMQCARASTSLLRKPDQSRAVAQSAQLFWTGKTVDTTNEGIRDAKKVISCLDRAQRLANDCVDIAARTQLLVEILNFNLIFYQQGVDLIDNQRIENIIKTIRELHAESDLKNSEKEQVSQFLANTLFFIEYKRDKGAGGIFSSINI